MKLAPAPRTERRGPISGLLRTARNAALTAATALALQSTPAEAQTNFLYVNWGTSWPSNWNTAPQGVIVWWGSEKGTEYTNSLNILTNSAWPAGTFYISNLVHGSTYRLQAVWYTNLPDVSGNQTWTAVSEPQIITVAIDQPVGLKMIRTTKAKDAPHNFMVVGGDPIYHRPRVGDKPI